MISIHALREEGDTTLLRFVNSFFISIHALREEGDRCFACCGYIIAYFYPRPPRGGRRWHRRRTAMSDVFLSTPSARRATISFKRRSTTSVISIHALREEGDLNGRHTPLLIMVFLSTPSARRATKDPELFMEYYEFLSTPSARRATPSARPQACRPTYFYPRPPRGGRPPLLGHRCISVDFYPRPPQGGRLAEQRYQAHLREFLSTPSARRATDSWCRTSQRGTISIHALREEGDGPCSAV